MIPRRRFSLPSAIFLGFPCGSDSKESACNVGDLGLIPELGRSPGERHDNPFQYSCLENPNGQRSLANRTEEPGRLQPWHHEELDMTEKLSTHILFILVYHGFFNLFIINCIVCSFISDFILYAFISLN